MYLDIPYREFKNQNPIGGNSITDPDGSYGCGMVLTAAGIVLIETTVRAYRRSPLVVIKLRGCIG